MHTKEYTTFRIHYNQDLSGEVKLISKGIDCGEIEISGIELLQLANDILSDRLIEAIEKHGVIGLISC